VRLANQPNAGVLAWIRDTTKPTPRRLWARRRIPVEAMRCHPDLCDRLEAISTGLGGRLRYVAGLPVLVQANNAIFAIAAGTSWIALRLPPHGQSAVVRSEWGRRGLDDEWIDVDPWLGSMPSRDGVRRLQGWCRASAAYAGELVTGRAPIRPA
jgi:hypothetical protein